MDFGPNIIMKAEDQRMKKVNTFTADVVAFLVVAVTLVGVIAFS